MYARLGPRGSKATTSAAAARGTVEMLSAPEWVKVSTDGPSQPSSLPPAGERLPEHGASAFVTGVRSFRAVSDSLTTIIKLSLSRLHHAELWGC